ncbi:MAG TPA: AAA-like domain-containing protein [Chthonomonadaceae bacterium]|nr:AAA-like domain-containing protein [Chthonomonadaceae bacterium]
MQERPGSGLTIRLFGPFEASRNGVLLTGLQTREGERLLALLLLNHGFTVQNTALASALWPETGSLDSLRQSVSHLRQVLEEDGRRLQAARGGLLLDATGLDVDVIAFDAAMAQGDTASLKQAIALYRGPLLHGWEERRVQDQHWVLRAREKRRGRYLEALRTLAKTGLAGGDPRLVIECLRPYIAANPAEEWAWADLMNALLQCGERVAALNLYERCRDLFQQKYNLTPPAEMTRRYLQLQQRPTSGTADFPADEATLEPVGGAVPLHSPYYIVRPADSLFQSAIARRDSLVLVKGPRQAGKTSLLARGIQQARETGAAVLVTDLQKMSRAHWESPEAFYLALAQNVADQLDLKRSPQDAWSDTRGANENFERYLRREVLERASAPIVWALDEVDRLFLRPFSDDVFALFRSWHNERALDPGGPWTRLTLAIAYATEAHLFIADLNQSPFNVGTRLLLEDFTREQVEELNGRHGSPLSRPEELEAFYRLVAGNPYLVRRGLYEMVTAPMDYATFEAQAAHDEGCYGDHLQRMFLALSQDAGLCQVVRELLRGGICPTQESFYRLRSAGIIVGDSPQNAPFRCLLYARYLEARLP